ncbi:hypothetical protein NL108_016150 [Boleophthalmus pectinirostris]|uniref:tripartite motif-containing protein 65-like n=1 Tax=Boleophthalmus pectinirostris TaxID=150288 RepID=UPI00243192FB|nr:tripartite motif-containing protein 65-like [Boleophthalmus pectinirostris]XP_055011315.1 tripartite motif-containing protein 65-like [Boleophthalmus pectinirostris]KAJ0069916.1 hypothetical protein NL108_016150 [Boleophthalmus pectinirostris]
MAEALSCPICLELLRDPVTIPCGHSYCMLCLQNHWDQQVTYSCPECRRHYSQRPVLGKNIMLSTLVQQLQRTAHPVDRAEERRAELQSQRALLLQNLQLKETELETLQWEAQDISRSARRVVQHSRDMFTEMTLLLENRRSEVERQILSEEKTQLRRVQELQDQLQQEVTELKRSLSELEELYHKPDHNQAMLSCPLLTTDTQSSESRFQTRPKEDFEFVTRAVTVLRDKLQQTLSECNVPVSQEPLAEPRCRNDFLKYAREITLDPNTVFPHLLLSDGNRKVTHTSEAQKYPEHSERFSVWSQVLSREELTGRCYFEVEWSVRDMVRIALSYRDIHRKGYSDQCGLGTNHVSWALQRMKDKLSFLSGGVQSEVPGPVGSRIGVYLDQSKGLSFYSVEAEDMTLLHRVHTSFTQPLLVGVLIVWEKNTVYFPELR